MNGAKNLCNVQGRSGIVTGIKVENTDIGTVRVYGTSTGSSPAAIGLHDIITLPAGNYYFYRNRQGSSVQGTSIQYFKNNTYIASINSDTAYAFTLTEASAVQFKVYFSAGQTVDAVYKPMIITEEAYDAGFTDYQPYALSNVEITPALIEQVDSGAKNVLQNIATTKTENNVTFTVNTDGSVKVQTTAAGASAGTNLSLTGVYISNKYGGYVISGISASTPNSIYLYVAYSNNGTSESRHDEVKTGNTLIIDGSYPYIQIILRVQSGTIATTALTVYPMICTLADWNVSHKYVPYRPNWDLVVSEVNENTETINTIYPHSDIKTSANSSYFYHGFKILADSLRGTMTLLIIGNGIAEACGSVTFSWQNSASNVYVIKHMHKPEDVKFYKDTSNNIYVVVYTPTKWDTIIIIGSTRPRDCITEFGSTTEPTFTQLTETAYDAS